MLVPAALPALEVEVGAASFVGWVEVAGEGGLAGVEAGGGVGWVETGGGGDSWPRGGTGTPAGVSYVQPPTVGSTDLTASYAGLCDRSSFVMPSWSFQSSALPAQ